MCKAELPCFQTPLPVFCVIEVLCDMWRVGYDGYNMNEIRETLLNSATYTYT